MNELEIEKKPTAMTANNHAIHKWFNFVAGYSPEYVEDVIQEYRTRNKSVGVIYDPFSGSATTNVVANSMGVKSIGVERNPFFFKIGRAKTNAQKILPLIEQIATMFEKIILIHGGKTERKDITSILSATWSESAYTFLGKLFELDDLYLLFLMREQVFSLKGDELDAGFIYLSKLLEYVTFAKTDGIYKAPTSKKHNLSILNAISKTKEDFLMGKDEILTIDNSAEMVFASSVDYKLEQNTVDLVIFSPPYLNNFDFAEMTRMQLYFWKDANSWGDISEKHRNHMIVNTTTALKTVRDMSVQDEFKNYIPNDVVKVVSPIVEELRGIKKENTRKKDYYLIVYPYLYQMMKVMENSYEGLKKGGEIHIIVSDAAFYGIHIDTQQYLALIMEDIGFNNVRIMRMRDRGDRWKLDKRKSSGKQLGEFEIVGEK